MSPPPNPTPKQVSKPALGREGHGLLYGDEAPLGPGGGPEPATLTLALALTLTRTLTLT